MLSRVLSGQEYQQYMDKEHLEMLARLKTGLEENKRLRVELEAHTRRLERLIAEAEVHRLGTEEPGKGGKDVAANSCDHHLRLRRE